MPRPPSLTAAAGLVALEALALLVLAVVEVAALDGDRLALGVTTTLFLGGLGAGLLACAWGLLQRRSWGRSPAVLAQLLTLGLAWNFRGEATAAVAAVLAAVAVVALAALLAPPTTRALQGAETGEG